MTDVYVAYPDAELVTLSILDPLDGEAGTWLESGFTPPYTQVNRIGGAPDNSDITDFALMRVAHYGTDRMNAWQLAAQGEALMIGARYHAIPVPEYGEDATILVDSVDIIVGGQQLPDVAPDDRRVVKDYLVGLRRAWRLAATP
jgi:hypothetical protein